jgi:hypothetical protein
VTRACRSIATAELFRTIVVIGMSFAHCRLEVHASHAEGASPMKLTQNLSGTASLAPMFSPRPVPNACDLPDVIIYLLGQDLVEPNDCVHDDPPTTAPPRIWRTGGRWRRHGVAILLRNIAILSIDRQDCATSVISTRLTALASRRRRPWCDR